MVATTNSAATATDWESVFCDDDTSDNNHLGVGQLAIVPHDNTSDSSATSWYVNALAANLGLGSTVGSNDDVASLSSLRGLLSLSACHAALEHSGSLSFACFLAVRVVLGLAPAITTPVKRRCPSDEGHTPPKPKRFPAPADRKLGDHMTLSIAMHYGKLKASNRRKDAQSNEEEDLIAP